MWWRLDAKGSTVTNTIHHTGTDVAEVAADTDDLAWFVERGNVYVAELAGILDRVAATRAAVSAQIGSLGPLAVGAGPVALGVGAGLVAEAKEVNGFVGSVGESLAAGDGVTDPAAGGPLVDTGFVPDRSNGPLTYPLYVASQGSLATSASAQWAIRVNKQYFHPRVRGKWTGLSVYSRREWLALARDNRNWNTGMGQAEAVRRWTRVGRWAGRAGTATVLVSSAWSEWQELHDDPTLSTADRVGQTAAVAAATTAGSWGGVWAGSQAGVVIGTAICPGVGTAVGAVVGGFAGGLVGGHVGGEIGDEIKGAAGDLADETAELFDDAVDLGGDAIDVITFWD